MNLRQSASLALLLAVAAVGGWFVLNRAHSPHALSPVRESKAEPPPDAAISANATQVPAPQTPRPPAPSATSAVIPGAPMVRTTSTPPVSIVAKIAPSVTAASAVAQPEGRSDLEAVQFMLRDFRTRMGENPVGSNAEIMKAVMGGNEVRARLGPPEGQSVNPDGELVDRWGTPYFFHQLSKDKMEIRSAGPDRKLWTSDDLISK